MAIFQLDVRKRWQYLLGKQSERNVEVLLQLAVSQGLRRKEWIGSDQGKER